MEKCSFSYICPGSVVKTLYMIVLFSSLRHDLLQMTYKCMGDTEPSEAVVIASGYITVYRFSE